MILLRAYLVVFGLVLTACSTNSIGDPCLPESAPPNGYDPAETYVESNSPQCLSRACIVRELQGDPAPGCTQNCASPQDVEEHAYCSCRCDADGPTPGCECPDGFHCEPAGRPGSFCVRDLPPGA